MKNFLFKVAAVLLSLLVFLVLLEVVVRVFNLAQPRTGQIHPVFGTFYIPDSSAINQFGVRLDFGRHGFRGPTPELKKEPGVFRVILLGDSFLQAVALPYEQTCYSLLNEKFKKENKPIEVINMAVEGHGTIQEQLIYRHVAKKYDPDLVALFFYVGNDLRDNYPPGQKHRPGYELVGDKLKFVPVDPTTIRRGVLRDFLRKHVRIYSYLPDLFRAALSNFSEWFSEETRARKRAEHDEQFKQKADVGTTQYALHQDKLSPAWRVTLMVLADLNREIKADGGKLAIGVVPTMAQTYDRYWNVLTGSHQADQTADWDRFLPQKIIKNFAGAEKIDYIPLSERMIEAARTTNEMFYLDNDFHFNDQGQIMMARLLEEWILEEKAKKTEEKAP